MRGCAVAADYYRQNDVAANGIRQNVAADCNRPKDKNDVAADKYQPAGGVFRRGGLG